jgi:hypothetical protein
MEAGKRAEALNVRIYANAMKKSEDKPGWIYILFLVSQRPIQVEVEAPAAGPALN